MGSASDFPEPLVAPEVEGVIGQRWGGEDGVAEVEFAHDLAFGLGEVDDLEEAGFVDIVLSDDGGWYRRKVREEHALMQGPLAARMRELLGPEQQAHFVEGWRAMAVVLDKGELRPGRYRGRKPA